MPKLLPWKTRQIQSLNSLISAELLINLISTQRENNQFAGLPILHSMGYITRTTVSGASAIRGECSSDDELITYIVSDNKLYSVNSSWVVSSALGTLTNSTGIVDMVCDRLYVFILDITNTKGYYFNILTSTFGAITAPVFTALTNLKKAIYLNGFFGVVYGTGFIFSEPGDPTAWFADRQNNLNHNVTTGIIASNKMILPGSSILDFWIAPANPNSNLPVQFQVNRQYGCVSPFSIVSIQNTAYWVGTIGRIPKLLSSTFDDVQPVGNEDFDTILAGLVLSDIESFCFADRGMVFYLLSAPTSNKTYLFNITHGTFSSLQLANGNYLPIRGYSNANGNHVLISPTSNKIYEMSNSIYQYDTGDSPRIMQCYTLYDEDRKIRLPLVRLHLDTSSYSSAQSWSLAMSYDGGVTYQTPLTDTVVAGDGYAQFTRFSAGRKVTPKISYTGNFPVCMVNFTGIAAISGREAAS